MNIFKKNWVRFVLIVVSLVSNVHCYAFYITVNGIEYRIYSYDSTTANVSEILRCNGGEHTVIIPSEVKDSSGKAYTVTGFEAGNIGFGRDVWYIYLSNGLLEFGAERFAGKSIRRINIPPSIRTLEYPVTSLILPVFYNCEYLNEVIIDDSTTPLPAGCLTRMKENWAPFAECTNIEKLYLGRNLTWSGNHPTFCDVNSFKEIITGDYVSNFEGLNLENYTALEKFVIGLSILKVPMVGSGSLKIVACKSPFPPIAEGFTGAAYINATLYVPKGASERFKSAEVWKNFYKIVETEDFENFSGLNDIQSDKEHIVYEVESNLLTASSNNTLFLYDTLGRQWAKGTQISVYIPNGLYLLKSRNQCVKISVSGKQ